MDKEKQRIKIAEACGWRLFSQFKNLWAPPRHVVEYDCDAYPLPDYLNDLNVMHEAEELFYSKAETLEGAEHMRDYSRWLCRLAKYPLHATAAQRAEAFLKTLNLWEE